MNIFDKITQGIYTIAEMSANHAGSIDTALSIVRSAKESGADCLKIQTYTADTLTIDCDNDYFKIKGGLWDGYKLYDLYKEAYMPWEWQAIIKSECDKLGLDFLSTPFDKTSVDFLEKLNIEFYKIASFELIDIPLIEYTASKGKPMIMSCGMASEEEIQQALDACYSVGNKQVVLLKCCSEYPANYSDMNIATIFDMQSRFKVPVGLSDHSMGSMAAVVAVSLGACVIEKHFCVSRKIKNPDSEFSMEPQEFRQMITDINIAKQICGKVNYELTDKEKASTVFRRSLFAIKDIKKGEAFTEENVKSIRPSFGLKPVFYNNLLQTNAKRSYQYGDPILKDEVQND